MAKRKYPVIPIDEALGAEVDDDIIAINRSACVVKGGRRFSFSAVAVVGNRSGLVGIGYGKAIDRYSHGICIVRTVARWIGDCDRVCCRCTRGYVFCDQASGYSTITCSVVPGIVVPVYGVTHSTDVGG